VDAERAKEILPAVHDGRDIYEEILGTAAAQGPQTPRRRQPRRKKNAGLEAPLAEV
jgi:hypothetical protein